MCVEGDSHNKDFVLEKWRKRVCGEQTNTLATMAFWQMNSEYPGKSLTEARIKRLAFTLGEHFQCLLPSVYQLNTQNICAEV